jgi:hypothetical protein
VPGVATGNQVHWNASLEEPGRKGKVKNRTLERGVETIANSACSIRFAKSDYNAAQTPSITST